MAVRQLGTAAPPTAQAVLRPQQQVEEQQVEESTGRCEDAETAPLLRLQRRHGNRYVQRLLGRARSGPGADAPAPAGEQVRSVLRAGGVPLDPSFRARAESFLGADFSRVRVHTGTAAAESARAVQSQAYTSGVHIVFGQGMYDTRSTAGQNRLVHELIHVVQQQRGPVAGADSGDGLSLSDPSDRFEREAGRWGDAFVSAGTPHGARAALVPRSSAGTPATAASVPVHIQRFKIPSGGATFYSGAFGTGRLYLQHTEDFSLAPRGKGSGGYDAVESHVTVFPRDKGGDQADDFHITFVLTPNGGEAGAGRLRKKEQAERAAKAKEESTAAARHKGSLAKRTSARFDTSGGPWRRGEGGESRVYKDISIHFFADEKGVYRDDFDARFGKWSSFNTKENYKKLSDEASVIAEYFVREYL